MPQASTRRSASSGPVSGRGNSCRLRRRGPSCTIARHLSVISYGRSGGAARIGASLLACHGATQPIINPATEETIAAVPRGSEEDVDRAVKAAAAAFEGWSDTPPGERSLQLMKLADRLEERTQELAALEAPNSGKPITVALAEVPFLVDNLRFFAGAPRCLA